MRILHVYMIEAHSNRRTRRGADGTKFIVRRVGIVGFLLAVRIVNT
jgi:hypothetical protein